MEPLKISTIQRRIEVSQETKIETSILPLNPLPPAGSVGVFVRERTSDPICHELALECDRYEQILMDGYSARNRDGAEATSIIAKRVSALKLLGERLDRMRDRDQVGVEVTATARALRLVKTALREVGVVPEQRELIYQKLISLVNAEMGGSK